MSLEVPFVLQLQNFGLNLTENKTFTNTKQRSIESGVEKLKLDHETSLHNRITILKCATIYDLFILTSVNCCFATGFFGSILRASPKSATKKSKSAAGMRERDDKLTSDSLWPHPEMSERYSTAIERLEVGRSVINRHRTIVNRSRPPATKVRSPRE